MKKRTDQLSFTTLKIDQAHRISHLWQKLNNLHWKNSEHFKDHFAKFTFTKRISDLEAKDLVKIFCANRQDDIIGYCLASIHGGTGELDSLYVEEKDRQSGVGTILVEMALIWFVDKKVEKTIVSVAHGNERALPFYQKLGFRERLIILEKVKPCDHPPHHM